MVVSGTSRVVFWRLVSVWCMTPLLTLKGVADVVIVVTAQAQPRVATLTDMMQPLTGPEESGPG